MAKNQPVNVTTQVGVVNGLDEGYATLTDLANALGVGGDGVVTGATLSAANTLTLTRSVGADVTVDLSSLAGGGSDGVVTGATLSAANVLTLTRSVGADVTVDLSALAGGAATTSAMSQAAGVLTHNDGATVPTVTTFDLPALVSANATDAESLALLGKGTNAVIDATAAEIATLDGDDDFIIDIDGVGLRRVSWADLPAGGGASANDLWDQTTGVFDISSMTDGQSYAVHYAHTTNTVPRLFNSTGNAVTGFLMPGTGTTPNGMFYVMRSGNTLFFTNGDGTDSTDDGLVSTAFDTAGMTIEFRPSFGNPVPSFFNADANGLGAGASSLPASVAAAWDASTSTLDAPALAGASGSFMLRGALASVDILDAMQFVTDDVNIALGAPFTAMYAADTSVPSPSGQWFFSAITPDDDADNDAATHGRKVAFGGGTTQSLGHPGGTGFFKVEPRLLRFNAGAAGVFGVGEHLHISLDEGFTWSKLL